MSEIKVNTITKRTGSTITIGESGTTVSLASGASSSGFGAIEWQSVVTSNTTMVAGRGYFVNTTSGAITMTLPASASAGDQVAIKDYTGTFATNSVIIARNSHKIQGLETNSELKTIRASVLLTYVDATEGWVYTQESNVGDLQIAEYISATGGTESTSGNFKIHTFNSSSNFVVASLGNAAGGGSWANKVDYAVVAGGGGGGSRHGGGGGAGGFREGRVSAPEYTASPLVAPDGLTVTAQTYPVTVGAGGAGRPGGCVSAGKGGDSVFSTITSAGGGIGMGIADNGPQPGNKNGGSGGGGVGYTNAANGSGNTPPVSPPQGNNGGQGYCNPNFSGGGGGGATAAGANAGSGNGGNGGAGATTHITGSPVTRAGGGGGGSGCSSSQGTGGSGGGGNGEGGAGTAPSGTANTGSGGGGSRSPTGGNGASGSGGSGVVIVRYKYQN